MESRVFEKQEPESDTWGGEGVEAALKKRLGDLSTQVTEELISQGFPQERIEIHPFLNMRLVLFLSLIPPLYPSDFFSRYVR